MLKFALGYRLMNMSTTQWIKNFVFYSNSFRDNTQNKTHSRIRNTCYNYPTGIARVYFIKKSQNKTNLLNLSSLSIWFSCISGVIFETYLSWLSSSRLKAEYREWFYRSRSAWCIQKVCIWWKLEAYMYLKHVPIPKGVILPLHLVGFIS